MHQLLCMDNKDMEIRGLNGRWTHASYESFFLFPVCDGKEEESEIHAAKNRGITSHSMAKWTTDGSSFWRKRRKRRRKGLGNDCWHFVHLIS